MTLSLHRVSGREVARAFALNVDLPVFATLAVDDGKAVAAGGLTWGGGRCWIWFAVEQPDWRYRFAVIREARKMLARAVQLGEMEVYTQRDVEFPTSEKLLRLLGFEPVPDEIEVWRWQH